MQDTALAVLVLETEWGHLARTGEGVPATGVIAVLAAGLMFLRRRHPVVTVALVGMLDMTNVVLDLYDPPRGAITIALYTVGRHTAPRVAALVLALTVAADLSLRPEQLGAPGAFATLIVLPMAAVAAGHIMRLRRELADRREAEAERARHWAEEEDARERRQAAKDAVWAERRRIARELHDVVAHHVSVINLYMGVARRTIPADPGRAQEALRTGEDTAKRAMAEMRKLLDVLRTDGEAEDDAAEAGAARLPALLAESGNARLDVVGDPVGLPSAVDHAVYRIVQEALTNTRKHGGGAPATVRLTYRAGTVEVEVLDDGEAPPVAGDGGLGLAGMAERVSLCGGELRTGPRPEGGFQVFAAIPLPPADGT
ncbi:hypothetical protein Ssi02_23940 [Sinosporangium siamense]|uniref:histidine kinase n=1 Tax=Sinosporangium siamense TaxID=1367973 RepID=A0A919V661_9ACTN|nr:hypothetical protein Ssi02_23940 [Sinosporangium siamense]